VLWWDGQVKRRATPGNLGPSQITDAPAASDFGLDRELSPRQIGGGFSVADSMFAASRCGLAG